MFSQFDIAFMSRFVERTKQQAWMDRHGDTMHSLLPSELVDGTAGHKKGGARRDNLEPM
jgi:hypothetical protein